MNIKLQIKQIDEPTTEVFTNIKIKFSYLLCTLEKLIVYVCIFIFFFTGQTNMLLYMIHNTDPLLQKKNIQIHLFIFHNFSIIPAAV